MHPAESSQPAKAQEALHRVNGDPISIRNKNSIVTTTSIYNKSQESCQNQENGSCSGGDHSIPPKGDEEAKDRSQAIRDKWNLTQHPAIYFSRQLINEMKEKGGLNYLLKVLNDMPMETDRGKGGVALRVSREGGGLPARSSALNNPTETQGEGGRSTRVNRRGRSAR